MEEARRDGLLDELRALAEYRGAFPAESDWTRPKCGSRAAADGAGGVRLGSGAMSCGCALRMSLRSKARDDRRVRGGGSTRVGSRGIADAHCPAVDRLAANGTESLDHQPGEVRPAADHRSRVVCPHPGTIRGRIARSAATIANGGEVLDRPVTGCSGSTASPRWSIESGSQAKPARDVHEEVSGSR